MAAGYPCTFLGLKVFQVSRGCLGICSKTWLSSLTCGPVPDRCGRCWAQGCVWEPVSAPSRAPSCVQPQDLFCTCTLRSLANSGAGGTDSLMSLFVRPGKQTSEKIQTPEKITFPAQKFQLNYKESLCASAHCYCPKTGSYNFRSCL